MKKTAVFVLSVLFLASCGNSSKKEEVADDIVVASEEVITNPDPATSAQNALDYEGTYKGLLPAADGEGIETTIVLGENDYTKEILYVGKDKTPNKTSGNYKWDETGFIITLEGQDKPNQYFVGENTLTQLDTQGQKISGELASKYILTKK